MTDTSQPPTPTPPIRVPGYELLDLAGEGGMATVWRARQEALQREVAIKILTTELSGNPEDRERFRQEAKATALINHPHVVRAHDAGEAEGHSYYIMEFVEGVTISDLLEAGNERMEPERALFIVRTLAEALASCWEHHGIIHCDIKPENVMIDLQGTVKLADLGLARVIGHGRRITEDEGDFILGTPNYMAPEQALAEEDLDPRADMYALGAMLYHMLSGEPPFMGLEPQDVLQRQVDGTVPDVWGRVDEVSEGLSCLLEVLMAKDRTKRPADWRAVVTDLRRVQKGLGPATPLPPPGGSTLQADAARPTPPWELEGGDAGTTQPLFGIGDHAGLVAPRIRRPVRGTGRPAYAPVAKAPVGRAAVYCLVVWVLAVLLYGMTLQRHAPAAPSPAPATAPQ